MRLDGRSAPVATTGGERNRQAALDPAGTGECDRNPDQARRPCLPASGRAPEAGAAPDAGRGTVPVNAPTAPSDDIGGEPALRPPTVLVIEDEPNIAEAIRFILQRAGWPVATHDRGSDALECIEAIAPRLVILDVMLPGGSGFDILQALRGHPRLADIPVIMLTAKGQMPERERAERIGASLFMSKPFSNAALLDAVRRLLG